MPEPNTYANICNLGNLFCYLEQFWNCSAIIGLWDWITGCWYM